MRGGYGIPMNSPSKSEFLGIAIAIMILVLGVILGKAVDVLEVGWVVIGGVLTAAILFISVLISSAFLSRSHYQELDRALATARSIVPEKYPWLFGNREMLEIEQAAEGRAIWLVSPDLSNDILGGAFAKVVQVNIARGLTYTYIVPDTEAVRALLEPLKALFSSHPDRLRIRMLPDEQFRTLAASHMAIYNPHMDDDSAARVFLELPIVHRGHWIEVCPGSAVSLVGRWRAYADEAAGPDMAVGARKPGQ
jgi:hypothetical protein